MRQDALSS